MAQARLEGCRFMEVNIDPAYTCWYQTLQANNHPLHHKKDGEEMESQKDTQSSGPEPEDLNIGSLNIDGHSNLIAPATLKAKQLNDASKDKFEYGEPLKKGYIRLFQLQPGSGHDPIVCSLLLSPLEGGLTPFEAVSYVWGSEDNPHPITCNWVVPFMDDEGLGFACPQELTNNMTVTDSLYQLLLRIRHPEGMRTLWIDQICIDQDKNPEKLQEKMAHVRMMAEVYSAADNVLIWLGEEDSETATAFGMMKWVAVTIEMSEQELGSLISYLATTEDFSNDETEDLVGHKQNMEHLKSLLVHVQPAVVTGMDDPASPNSTHMTLLGSRALAALLEKPWFTRSWTFQETVSARSATIVCGSHEVKWDILYQACKSMQARRMFVKGAYDRINMAFVVESTVKKGDLRRDWARLKRMSSGDQTSNSPDDSTWLRSGVFLEQRKIKRLLPLLRSTACKDPRDKVLAILGISHDDNRWIVFPDYEWDVVNLYTSIVSYWIWGVGKMDISFLNHIQDSNPKHKLPSWVPDWSTPVIATPLIDLADFSASGDTVPNVFMDEIDYLGDLAPFPHFPPLAIEGFFILKVQDVETDLTNYERHAEIMSQFENPYPTTELSYLEAYQKTVYPKIPEGFRPLERAEGTPSFWEYTNNHSPKTIPSSPESTTTTQQHYTAQDLQSQLPDLSTPSDPNSQIQHHTRAPGPGRAFFVSTTGFIGLCSKDTIPGDEIYILLGAATPFVIRVPEDKVVRRSEDYIDLRVETIHGGGVSPMTFLLELQFGHVSLNSLITLDQDDRMPPTQHQVIISRFALY
ncbi:heterokaryon incompatibility protein-domain-containing protein [Bisporella sp. PMI_857]|nr:heterokaryon incompatibility protein-domain-containing protein [Bisporella sp. PMI_857]